MKIVLTPKHIYEIVRNPSPTKHQISIIEEIDLGQQNHIPLCIEWERNTEIKFHIYKKMQFVN